VSLHFGIDLGGTRTKALALDSEGERLSIYTGETRVDRGVEGLVKSVRDALAVLVEEAGRPGTIGLCAPGLARPDARCIAWMPGRMSALENLDWTEVLDLSLPVAVLNDAQAALRGEHWLGAAAGSDNVIMLTLGTGVGGAIIADGRLLRGHLGRAGHLGHLSIRSGGPPGITGVPGTLEQTLSKEAFKGRLPTGIDSVEELVEASRVDGPARDLWLGAIHEFGRGLVGLINVCDPEKVVLGGGIAQAGDALLAPLREAFEAWEWRPGGAQVELAIAALGDWAGACGAAREAMEGR